jgi:NAD(P)-dependent dehydrogenase (short-subunit alcohol dehydrogenase family)
MEAQGGGTIVNISSIASLRYLSVPTFVYSTAKAALNEFTKNIAAHYAAKGIRANCVLPGYIATPFVRRQNIWLRLGLRLAEFRPHHGVDIKRRSCGAASVDVG